MKAILNKAYVITASCFVAAVLGGQVYTTFVPIVGDGPGMHFWPIVSYAMYSRPHYEGETVEVYDLLEGTLSDGSVVEIPMESLGLGLWYYRDLVAGLKKNDPVAIDLLTKKFPSGAELTEVRVKSYPLMVTRDGPAEKASEILHSLTLPGVKHAETDMAAPAITPEGAPALTEPAASEDE